MGRRHPLAASWEKLINLFTVGIIRPYFFVQILICHRFVIMDLILLSQTVKQHIITMVLNMKNIYIGGSK